MDRRIRNFFTAISVITIICVSVQFAWNGWAPSQFLMRNGWWLLGVFVAVSSLVHLFLLQSAKGNAQAFIRKFMAATVFKFMFYILLIVVLMLFTADSKPGIILHFIFYYLVFTILEVAFLYKELRKFS